MHVFGAEDHQLVEFEPEQNLNYEQYYLQERERLMYELFQPQLELGHDVMLSDPLDYECDHHHHHHHPPHPPPPQQQQERQQEEAEDRRISQVSYWLLSPPLPCLLLCVIVHRY